MSDLIRHRITNYLPKKALFLIDNTTVLTGDVILIFWARCSRAGAHLSFPFYKELQTYTMKMTNPLPAKSQEVSEMKSRPIYFISD